ncbi:colicin E3-like toxin immunity protein [Pseudomonas lurida]|uniref:colicin E3-like toxin immunity protein n=1 Tax=Pseudomonas lurida TaxID=244566 RepID=UPI0027361CB0|nr:colicin E3-like toxin immunity protein [Pseudomonas lurida]WLG27623.1 colicin E3-like toxin immunity protein [Pseudomonas lurida]
MKAEEYPTEIADPDSVFKALGLGEETAIYADVFNVQPTWTTIIQPYFQHIIEPDRLDHQIFFRYLGVWPPTTTQTAGNTHRLINPTHPAFASLPAPPINTRFPGSVISNTCSAHAEGSSLN